MSNMTRLLSANIHLLILLGISPRCPMRWIWPPLTPVLNTPTRKSRLPNCQCRRLLEDINRSDNSVGRGRSPFVRPPACAPARIYDSVLLPVTAHSTGISFLEPICPTAALKVWVRYRRQTCPRSVLTQDPIECQLKGVRGRVAPTVVQIKDTAQRSCNSLISDTCFVVGKKCHCKHDFK